MLSDVDVLIEYVTCADTEQKLDVQAVQVRKVISSAACRQAVLSCEVTVTQSSCELRRYCVQEESSKFQIPTFFQSAKFYAFLSFFAKK